MWRLRKSGRGKVSRNCAARDNETKCNYEDEPLHLVLHGYSESPADLGLVPLNPILEACSLSGTVRSNRQMWGVPDQFPPQSTGSCARKSIALDLVILK